MRRTKIVCTIGPSTCAPARLRELIEAGMDVARLNFSHGSQEDHGRAIADIRRTARELGRPVAILQDLAGPKVRVGPIAEGPVALEHGQAFTLTSRDVPGDAREASLTYKNLPRDVRAGDTLLLSDGALELTVEEVVGEDIHCRVVVGGPLNSHKGINLPRRSIGAPILSEKDLDDLDFGLAQGVDYVALSFVRNAAEVEEARRRVQAAGKDTPLIAKIEKHEALVNIDEIVAAVDGIMVARGDLGVEIPLERAPRVQKMLIGKANRAGKPVITATQMLASMVRNPRPTRAEATDVANAVLDGSDAVMLSEETAVGEHPIAAVRIMSRIIAGVEPIFPFHAWADRLGACSVLNPQEAVAHAACDLANPTQAAAIVTCTLSGSTTRYVSKYRPPQPILAPTPDEATYRRLALIWGVAPLLLPPIETEAEMERQAIRLALESGRVRPGQTLVIVAGVPLHVPGATNLIKVVKAESQE